MRAAVRVGATLFDLDFANPVDLSRAIEFGPAASRDPGQPFGAPVPTAVTLQVGRFVGDVARGGSCNCATISLTPHASGTHTEGVGHLTRGRLDVWRVAPVGLLPCLLLRVEHPRAGGGIVTAAALEAAWPREPAFVPLAVVVACGFGGTPEELLDPPWLAPEAAALLVARGVEHLVVELPSLDRRDDGGALAAHRVFFGLPARSVDLDDARRAAATVTELAAVPAGLPGGSYFLALQVPAIAGDAVPSRPLLYPLAAARP